MSVIGVRQYAKLRGVSPAAVSKAIKFGRLRESIVRDKLGHPKISDAALADAEWLRNTRPRSEPSASKSTARPAAPAPSVATAAKTGVPSYADSRARNEAAKAGLSTLQLMKEKGKLVDVEGVRVEIAKKFSEIRSKLLGVPSRLIQRSSTVTSEDAGLVENLIREALEALADEISTD